MATVLTSEQAAALNAIAEARGAAAGILELAAMIREPAPRREVFTFDCGGAVPDNEPVTEFKNGRPVTYANKHAYYAQWYQANFGLTAEEADECATEAVARLPKPTALTDEQRRVNKKLGVSDEDFLKYNS